MALFKWEDLYSVGVDTIDQQHQHLFHLANRFAEAYESNTGKHVLAEIFDELIAYTQTHFTLEEKIMREADYPGYFRHKQNHEKLVKLVLGYKHQFENDEKNVESNVMNFIKTWLNGHILGMDRNYRRHVWDSLDNSEMSTAA